MSSNKSFSTETSDRYAKAVFELAQENNEIENLENEIKDLSNFYDTDSEFVNFIMNPTQSIENQLNVIKKISEIMKFSKTLKKVSVVELRLSLISALISSSRTKNTPVTPATIEAVVQSSLSQRKGEVSA